jgi:hypothetical protein
MIYDLRCVQNSGDLQGKLESSADGQTKMLAMLAFVREQIINRKS